MRLSWLEVIDFRSFDRLRWTPDPSVNVLVGRNAAGKTNLLEAVGYLAALRSFRNVPDRVLVKDGAERAVLRGEVAGEGRSTLIEVEAPAAGRRRAQVNRERLGRVSDLLGLVRSAVFLPDDLDMVKRGPGYRRDLLDATAVQIWPGAHRDQQDYEKALRQRNMLLKQSGRQTDEVTLLVWDDRLAEAGGRVMARRTAAIEALEERAGAFYRELSGEGARVVVDYRSTWGAGAAGRMDGWRAALGGALSAARPADLDRRLSTVGPHRDDVRLLLDDRDSRTRASQGEQRCLVLALRLAAHQAVAEITGEAPLLLLDDVFSELDPHRFGGGVAARVAVVHADTGKPVRDVDVLLVYPNKTYLEARTDAFGHADLELYANLPMTVFCAAPGFAAEVVPDYEPGDDAGGALEVRMRPVAEGGSKIIPSRTGHAPGIRGRLNPIRDTLDRLYVHADNVAVNDGAAQPVVFQLNEPLKLTDALGNTATVWFREAIGASSVFDYAVGVSGPGA